MTTSKAAERARVAGDGPGSGETIAGALALALREELRVRGNDDRSREFPLARFQADPEAFALLVLGVKLMAEQLEIVLAIRDQRRVAVAGGRKVGKDFALAVVALWFFCCFPGARVQFTAVTEEQVQRVFWRELGTLIRGSGRCLECKRLQPDGPRPCPHSIVVAEDVPTMARTGFKLPDGRELVGYTVGEAAAIRGISGGYQLDIIDEASDVDDDRIESLDGNKLGCVVGRTALLSNPSRTSGQFARAFLDERERKLWTTFYRSSLDIAKKYGGKIPGIARLEEIEEIIEKYGADSDFVTVHIHGRFPESSEGKPFPIHLLLKAQERWRETKAAGPLAIGVDVAGETGSNDQSAFAARRGLKLLGVHARRGLTPEQHLAEVLRIIAEHPSDDPNELPIVVLDIGGDAGSKVRGVFVAYMQVHWQDPPLRVLYVDSSRKGDKYQRKPKAYDRVRDELVANTRDWLLSGGAIPNDPRLARQLNEFRWLEQPIGSASKLIDKREMRKHLGGESPDEADAVSLSCWPDAHWRPPVVDEPEARPPEPAQPQDLQDANAIWHPGAGELPSEDPNGVWWPNG